MIATSNRKRRGAKTNRPQQPLAQLSSDNVSNWAGSRFSVLDDLNDELREEPRVLEVASKKVKEELDGDADLGGDDKEVQEQAKIGSGREVRGHLAKQRLEQEKSSKGEARTQPMGRMAQKGQRGATATHKNTLYVPKQGGSGSSQSKLIVPKTPADGPKHVEGGSKQSPTPKQKGHKQGADVEKGAPTSKDATSPKYGKPLARSLDLNADVNLQRRAQALGEKETISTRGDNTKSGMDVSST
ncbi:unnamed protein product [Linum trigynum]|uniref:Uncharacterized protein n=1 Tax=Linum trigynum TaxID=586398 RepID=A0AAV2G6Z7_9ROSI